MGEMLPSEGTCEPGASFRRPAQGRPGCLIHTSTRAVAERSTQLQIVSRPRYANRHRFGQPTWRYGFALTNTRTGNSRRACALSRSLTRRRVRSKLRCSFVAFRNEPIWRVRANLSGGTSSASNNRPSGNIQRPKMGRKLSNPPQIRRIAAARRIQADDDCLSHRTAALNRGGRRAIS